MEVVATWQPVQQPYPVALAPQQIGRTGEFLAQRMGYSWVEQPQYWGRSGTMFNAWYDPTDGVYRTAGVAFATYAGLQRVGMAPTGGTGIAAMGPATYNALVAQIGTSPANVQAAQAIWAASSPGGST